MGCALKLIFTADFLSICVRVTLLFYLINQEPSEELEILYIAEFRAFCTQFKIIK
jgi:hypothetical protein